jgi:nicotinamidase-related amidase
MFEHRSHEISLQPGKSALVLTDMQNDFLSPGGRAHALIAESLAKNRTLDNLERLMSHASRAGVPIFISPHYYYPHDDRWVAPRTPLEALAHEVGLVRRDAPWQIAGIDGSGADFPARYKPYIHAGDCTVTSPHKAYSASTNDLVLQLRRRRVEQVVLAGPVGNLCVEGHLRDLIEHGFEVAMIRSFHKVRSPDNGASRPTCHRSRSVRAGVR